MKLILFFHLQKGIQLVNFFNTKMWGPITLRHILLVIPHQLRCTAVEGGGHGQPRKQMLWQADWRPALTNTNFCF